MRLIFGKPELFLPIYYWSEEQSQLNELGIDQKVKDAHTRQVIFYHINAIGPYYDEDGKQRCSVHSNGTHFVCELSVNEVRDLKYQSGV